MCCDLLRRAPEDRPTGRRVLRRLGVVEARPLSPTPIAGVRHRPPLVGRSAELRSLHEAYVAARTRGSVVVRVRGPSGMGKSALVQHFLDGLVTRSDAVILRGCAYERESVAYKAVDGVVDALSRCLVAFEQRGEGIALPTDVWALACLFPVLRRVESIAAVPVRSVDDPQRVRQRAFGALRALLTELARLGPTILHLDDVHWGDVDSATLLLEVMRPPRAPPLLLILGHREGADSESSPFLKKLLEQGFDGADVRDIVVNPLGIEDARRLALDLMGVDDDVAQRVADAIARGSGGSAFFVEDLARSVHAQGLPANVDAFVLDAGSTIEQMIGRRVARLGSDSRDLLELIATHGRPVATSILRHAAGTGDGVDSHVAELQARHFVQLVTRDGREMVQTIHDRIRETVVAGLSADDFRSHHGRLARAYEAEPLVDAEAIVGHWFDARETARAAAYAERAAQQASDKLAFDRAVVLYELALATLPANAPEALQVRVRLAEALGWAGRGAEAARLYLEAVPLAPAEQRIGLEQAGANQLLMCGHIEEGTRILRGALARLGRGAPRSTWTAFFWLIVYTAWLHIIGLRFVERDPKDIPLRVRDQLQALYAAVTGLALVDGLVGTSLLARFMVLALRSGDRASIVAATALGANQLATRGGPVAGERERALAQIAEGLGENPTPFGNAPTTDMNLDRLSSATPLERPAQALQAMFAVRCFVRGRWKEAFEAHENAYAALPPSRGNWNVHAVAVFAEFALVFLGEPAELARRLPGFLADAERRGDRLKVVNLRTGVAPIVFLAKDDPGTARRHVLDSMAAWPQRGYLIQHWRAMVAEVDIDLYEGNGPRAYERLERDARAFRRSLLTIAQYVRAVTNFARARSAIATSRSDASPGGRRIREADRILRRLEREGTPWIDVLASLVAAALANAEGRIEDARSHLRAGVDRAHGADMVLHACAAQHRLGTLLGGEDGRALVQQSEEVMRAKGVRAPERYVAMLLPGNWGTV